MRFYNKGALKINENIAGIIATFIMIYVFLRICKLIKFIVGKLSMKNNKHSYSTGNLNRKPTFEEENIEKGILGEREFVSYLNRDNSYYKKILQNVYLDKTDGTTTELDVILICSFGIYVFEVKNYDNCFIFGSRNQKQWNRRSHKGTIYRIENPINQNLRHLDELKNHLNIKKYNLYKSIVIFVGNAEIKSYIPNIDSNFLLTKSDYNRLNYLIKENNIELLSSSEVDEIYLKLKPFSEVSELVKLNHRNRIKSYNNFKQYYYGGIEKKK